MESYAAEYEDVITTWSLPRDGRTIRNMADASSRNKAVYRTVKEAAVKVFDTITKVHSGVARHQPTGGLVRVVNKEFDSTRNSLRAGSPVQVVGSSSSQQPELEEYDLPLAELRPRARHLHAAASCVELLDMGKMRPSGVRTPLAVCFARVDGFPHSCCLSDVGGDGPHRRILAMTAARFIRPRLTAALFAWIVAWMHTPQYRVMY